MKFCFQLLLNKSYRKSQAESVVITRDRSLAKFNTFKISVSFLEKLCLLINY